ncbi:MAG: phosphatase PAP2 family protein, partial [Prevotella sp.]|nr:phosphatase PAP2 family protein [Prevotella sp.]
SRPRPTHDLHIGMLVDVVNEYRGGRYGFFSAHAANTFSVAIFFSLVVRHRILTIFMVTWSLVNCWTRMYLGVHYPGDILCGLIWGAIVGTTAYAIYMRFSPNYQTMSRFISSAYTRRGYLIADIDKVLMVFSATLLYAILRACWQ